MPTLGASTDVGEFSPLVVIHFEMQLPGLSIRAGNFDIEVVSVERAVILLVKPQRFVPERHHWPLLFATAAALSERTVTFI